jgi:arsenite-transporting ATPase
MDAFIDRFEADAARRRELLMEASRSAFVPVALPEPWVIEQTVRLIAEVRAAGIDVPFVIMNRAHAFHDARLEPVVIAAEAEEPLASAEAIERWTSGERPRAIEVPAAGPTARPATTRRLMFVAGKGGVGKTTTSASIALQLAARHPEQRFTVISVDPAHTLRDVFAREAPPSNLNVEMVDTKEKWRRFRDSLGEEIERAIGAMTPGGMSVAYDAEAMRKLVEIAPPGADELFAITRLADLVADSTQAAVIVDTAPTGHFLRLIDLPRTAGEWVREFMRILLRYRELIPPGSLGEELIRASRALHALEEALQSDETGVIVVTRREPVVTAETNRLIAEVDQRGMHITGVVVMGKRATPPVTLAEIATVVPI